MMGGPGIFEIAIIVLFLGAVIAVIVLASSKK